MDREQIKNKKFLRLLLTERKYLGKEEEGTEAFAPCARALEVVLPNLIL